MSTQSPLITLSSLKFIKPAELADALSQPHLASKIAVIDVRDNDHVGGHVKGSQWVPINQLDVRMPELLRTNAGKDRLVFHCMLSQQRGPKAALAYARAKQYDTEKLKKEQSRAEEVVEGQGHRTDNDEQQGTADDEVDSGRIGGQQICVLEGGFGNWQAFYGEDESLTEAYAKDLWV